MTLWWHKISIDGSEGRTRLWPGLGRPIRGKADISASVVAGDGKQAHETLAKGMKLSPHLKPNSDNPCPERSWREEECEGQGPFIPFFS